MNGVEHNKRQPGPQDGEQTFSRQIHKGDNHTSEQQKRNALLREPGAIFINYRGPYD
jgi:hypothetical protein